ncbi:hypothetical protein ACNKHU_00470 [Shigella flexneri]
MNRRKGERNHKILHYRGLN